jgi:pantoate--beta-alanine ligase
MMKPETIRTIGELRARVGAWRKDGLSIGMVPTMGALHRGHLALIEAAEKADDRVVVTLFVNPTQFAPTEDLSAYPRDEEADRRKLEPLGVDLLFAPPTAEMYPAGFDLTITIGGPAAGLETDFRPHHFAGVATIVSKLLTAGLPDRAYFGEKDFQQLLVVKKLVRDLGLPTEIIGCPTVRETDGLAMSSRNAYLNAGERAQAPKLYATLQEAARRIRGGEAAADAIAAGRARLVSAGFAVDYLEVRNAETLAPVASLDVEPLRLVVAAKLGRTRLIDNIEV